MRSLKFWTKENFEVTTEGVWNLSERINSVHTTSGNDES
jgi:hypothetical protein